MELKNTIVIKKYNYKNGLGETLTEDDIKRILARNTEASRMWKAGTKQSNIGVAIMVPGEIAMLLGIVGVFLPEDKMPTDVSTALIAAGTPLFITGVVIMTRGTKKQRNAVELFIENNQQKKLGSSWQIKGGITNSGNLGFVVNF